MTTNRTTRRFLRGVWPGFLLLIGIFAVIGLRQPWGKLPENGWLWFLLILAGVGLGHQAARIAPWQPEPRSDIKSTRKKAPPRIVFYCILISLALCVWIVLRLWPDPNQWDGTFLPCLVSIGLMICAGWLIGSVGPRPTDASTEVLEDASPRSGLRRVEIIGFILILLLAIFLRVYQIDRIPAGIFVDETNSALDALQILEGRSASPFRTGWYQTPNLYLYYMAAIIDLFGANFVSLKIISLLPALLTVVAIFFLGRHLFGPIGGLSAMLLLAISRWHFTMSRWGWNELMPPLFMILAFYFLIRGLKNHKAVELVTGGVLCGLMVYTYVGSRLAVVALLLYSLYWLFANTGGIKKNLPTGWKGLALFWIAALIVVAPLIVTYLKNPAVFLYRMQEVSIANDIERQNSYQPLVDNLVGHLKSFHQAGDNNGRHNLPGEPALDPITGLLFVIGIGYSLSRFRDTRSGLLWIWLALGLAGGILSVQGESPQAYRTIIAVPAIVLLCASVLEPVIRGSYTFLNKSPQLAPPTSGRRPQIVWAAVVAGGILLLIGAGAAVWDSYVYFGPQASSTSVQFAFNLPENEVARAAIAKLKNGGRVYLPSRFYYFSILNYLAAGLMKERTGSYQLENRPYQLTRPEVDIPIPDDGSSATFLIDAHYQSLIDYFKIFYPTAATQIISGPENTPLYIQIDIPLAAIQAAQGLKTQLAHADGRIENRIESTIDEIWPSADITAAEWTGAIRLEKSGVYEFKTEGDLAVSIDGQPVTGRQFFCEGLHDITVSQKESQQQKVARLSWVRPEGQEEVVPPQVLFQTPVPQIGLIGQYYSNATWQGDPICTRFTPFFFLAWPEGEPVPGPFSARYTGYLKISQAGNYHFTINADDGVRLTLDNQVVGEGLAPDRSNNLELNLTLEEGYHPIQLDYFQSGGGSTLEFYWEPPDSSGRAPVPPWVLSPTKP